MHFFVPKADPDEAESVYGQLAACCGRPVPAHGRRISSITFTHNGEQWTAEVGKRLSGSRTRQRRRKGGVVEVTTPLSDAATVLAIFGGAPYLVVTDARPLGGQISAWVNPFMAGQPTNVTYFQPSG